jgi:hypothetical protein
MHVTAFDNLNDPSPMPPRPVYKSTCVSAIRPDPAQPMEPPAHTLQNTAPPITVLNIGRVHDHHQDQTEHIHEDMPFTAFDLLARIVATVPPFSVLTVWLSKTAALGVGLRPAFRRTSSRRWS